MNATNTPNTKGNAMQYQYPHNVAELNANQWEEITDERADDLLGCVPPAAWKGDAFAVGEALCHLQDGRVVHEVVCQVEGKHYKKPCILREFNPDVYVAEIRRQLQK